MPRRKRRFFTAEQKSTILRRHHVEKVPVSQICEEAEIQPSIFYQWQKRAFENLDLVLQPRDRTMTREKKKLEDKIEKLQERLTRKDHVIAVLSEEHVALKKELGEP